MRNSLISCSQILKQMTIFFFKVLALLHGRFVSSSVQIIFKTSQKTKQQPTNQKSLTFSCWKQKSREGK